MYQRKTSVLVHFIFFKTALYKPNVLVLFR